MPRLIKIGHRRRPPPRLGAPFPTDRGV